MIFFIYSFSALLVSYTLSLLAALPISPHLPFLVAAALAGITLVLSASLLRETRPPGSNGSHAQQPGTAKLTAVPGMLILLAVFGIVQFIGQAPGSTWEIGRASCRERVPSCAVA